MKTLDPRVVGKTMAFRQYKDKLRITQSFGGDYKRYGMYGHCGLDLGEYNRLKGDNLYAPFDGKVLSARNWSGWKIGWEFFMESNPTIIDGIEFVVRLGYTHTRGKSKFKNGDKVKKGDIVDISGGIFQVNSWWTGQHTHVSTAIRYNNGDQPSSSWQPDWQNGHAGYNSPMLFIQDRPPLFLKDGLMAVQIESILNLLGKKPVKLWTKTDIANWNYATHESPIPKN